MRTARRIGTPRRLPALITVLVMIAGVASVEVEETWVGVLSWLPPGHGDAGPASPIYHPWNHTPAGPAVPGLWRYPMFHGHIPPTPHDDTLYQSGVFPSRWG